LSTCDRIPFFSVAGLFTVTVLFLFITGVVAESTAGAVAATALSDFKVSEISALVSAVPQALIV
jgi:hypothetical protein